MCSIAHLFNYSPKKEATPGFSILSCIALTMADMLEAFFKNVLDMIVRKRVIHYLALLLKLDEVAHTEGL